MFRLLLVAVLVLVPSAALAADHDVHGYTLPDSIRLEDSILGPGAPVALAWVPTTPDHPADYWEGAGNGVTYRVVREGGRWMVRCLLPEGDFALAWSLVAYPGQVPAITSPVFRDTAGGGCGPLINLYGNSGSVVIKLTP